MDEKPMIPMPGRGMNSAVLGPPKQALAVRLPLSAPALSGYPDCAWQQAADFSRQVEAVARSLPAAWIPGQRDRLVAIEPAQQIADFNPGIRVESVAGAAHAPPGCR